MPLPRSFFPTLLLGTFSLLGACATSVPPTPFVSAEPEVGSTLSVAPRTLRIYFTALPDVERSEVEIQGPNGELNLRGLHTMGADDLMLEIYDEVGNGEYEVRWQTYVAGDANLHTGSYKFYVQTD